MIDQNFEKIKRIVSDLLPESEVVLFGSRARQTNRDDSDYDLLILIEKDVDGREKMHLRTRVRMALGKLKIYADVLVQSKSEARLKKELPGHIIRRALTEGIQL
jgi:predicted nucleotidyltransferase